MGNGKDEIGVRGSTVSRSFIVETIGPTGGVSDPAFDNHAPATRIDRQIGAVPIHTFLFIARSFR